MKQSTCSTRQHEDLIAFLKGWEACFGQRWVRTRDVLETFDYETRELMALNCRWLRTGERADRRLSLTKELPLLLHALMESHPDGYRIECSRRGSWRITRVHVRQVPMTTTAVLQTMPSQPSLKSGNVVKPDDRHKLVGCRITATGRVLRLVSG